MAGKSQAVPSGVRAVVLARDGHRCARCDVSCLNVPASVHHRKARGMGGTRDPRSSDPRNLILLCGTGTTGCHDWVESHRDAARDAGWLLRGYHELDRPLITRLGTRIVLFADGSREDIWPQDDRLPSEVNA